MTNGRGTRTRFVTLVVVLGVVLDQAVKLAVFQLLRAGQTTYTVAGGWLQLRAIENRGALLGIGSGLASASRLWLFTIAEGALLVSLVAVAVLAARTRRLELWAVALVAAGGAGNVADRIAVGFVRDYLVCGVPGVWMTAFNLADVLVVLGGGLLLAALLRAPRSRPGVVTAMLLAALASTPGPRAEAPAAHPFPVRMVKLGGSPGDPRSWEHVRYCRSLGFNVLWVYSGEAGRWTKAAAPHGPVVDRDFMRLARWCKAHGMTIVVSLNPVSDSHDRFVFSDPDGVRRIVAFAKKLRTKAGITGFVVSFDDDPLELHEFADAARFGPSAAPAHLDLVRQVAANLPSGLPLWFCAAAYCDAHLADGTGPYSKPLLEGLSTLPASVGMVWTGPKVLSPSITGSAIETTRARLGGRPILLYDNFPVNDDGPDDAIALILGALRHRDAGLRDVVAAYLACPMTELSASRLSLMTTAEYLADPEHYDPDAAAARAVNRLAGTDRQTRTALETQQIEWGGFIEGHNYWPRDAMNAGLAGKRLGDPAFVESFTWTADRYPARMTALRGLDDPAFGGELLRFMQRRLVIARSMPLVIEYGARKRAGRDDAAEVLAQIEVQRRALDDDPDAARILDLFLRAANVPIS